MTTPDVASDLIEDSVLPARPEGMVDIVGTDFLTNCSWVRDKVTEQMRGKMHDHESKRKMI